MSAKRKTGIRIPVDVKRAVEETVRRFNGDTWSLGDCYYEAKFTGSHCYLHRSDHGSMGPICRLTYTAKMDEWAFAIFKWSSETYDPDEWMFPGSELVDGTVEGAMTAGLQAYPA